MSYDLQYKQFIKNVGIRLSLKNYPLLKACIAEACGTAILVILGCGVLAQVHLGDHGKKAHGSFISVSIGWGFAVYLGAFFAGVNGHGNINPAITLAFAFVGKVPWKRVPYYTLAQVFGGFIGALAVFGVYSEKIMLAEAETAFGSYNVTTTGNIFVTNPWASILTCFFDQVMGTALLAAGALAIIDSNGWNMPGYLHPLHLGLLVYVLVGAFALNAGAALNPARDLGPRLMIAMCGWGTAAFTSGNYYFWVPIIGPYLGAFIGSVLYELTVGNHLDRKSSVQGDKREMAELIS